ncbi:MAG: hypothetical protein A2381_06970 [Bdellovibrionales bacterium RIFOXYB1_FULL_37_110]|nr:MAG: hypothetical protein A2417_14845 [Bdellovibrionales bacterium RIFOXYC1_FULL_37_79]OFZ57805.1 MAG: hypothetical protein A2381_06970 [Bdellovibrionales bacterium RIFOXYB1_FULL_37_110]OFZ62771.1 MAG: hypothetical protein A2577_16490 [Bdellovibrionales bacterium RIFOXYD1_FULL_36_51]
MIPKDKEQLLKEFGDEFEDIIKEFYNCNEEVADLLEIGKISASIEGKLLDIYKDKFPKTCQNCKRVYKDHQEFLRETTPLEKTSTIYLENYTETKRVQEYRNCRCGSTLLIACMDRRDNSETGKLRRDIFDVCVSKIEKITEKNPQEIQSVLRQIFKKLFKKLYIG